MAPLMLQQMISASSGTALVGLFVLSAIAAELLARRGQRRHALVYAGGAGVIALFGLMLAVAHAWRGGSDAVRAGVLSAIYGTGGLISAARGEGSSWVYLGLALLTAAPLWLLWAIPPRTTSSRCGRLCWRARHWQWPSLPSCLRRLVAIGQGSCAGGGR